MESSQQGFVYDRKICNKSQLLSKSKGGIKQTKFIKQQENYFLEIYFWLCWVSIAAYGLSLVMVSGSCSPVAVHGLLIAVASLVSEYGLQCAQAQQVQRTGQLSCSMWNIPRPGIEPMLPALAVRFLTTRKPGQSQENIQKPSKLFRSQRRCSQ